MESKILKRVEELRRNADNHLQNALEIYPVSHQGAARMATLSLAQSQLALLELEMWKVTWGPLVRPPHPLCNPVSRYPSPDERGKWVETYPNDDGYVDWPTEPGWYWATKSYDTAIVYVDDVGETLTIMRINPGSPGKVGISDEWKWFGPLLSPWEVEDGLHED